MFRARQAALAVLMSAVLVLSGCPTAQQWFQIIGSLLPIVGQTYLQFYGFTQKGGVGADDIAKVQALTTAGQDAINQVAALVQVYEQNKSASTIVQIKGIVQQLQNNVGAFLGDAQIKNSTRFSQYQLFAQAILADLVDILSIIPVVGTGPQVTARAAKVALPNAKNMVNVFKLRLAVLPT